MQRKNAVVELDTYRTEDASTAHGDAGWSEFLPAGTELLLGQYRITDYLNCGGFGITYLAQDSLGRTVVVKECFPSAMCFRSGKAMAVRSPRYKEELASIVRHFVGEAHRLANVSHPNIVHVHQIFEENDTAYIAMDFIDGPDLLDVIEDEAAKLSPDQVIALTQKLLRAIKYLHDRGLLHRDISPDNVLIGRDGEPVLIDFGAAREHSAQSRRALSKLKFVKDGYSPQEFYLAGSDQGTFSDIYSLAASLYHLITGHAPVDAQARIAALATKKSDPYEQLEGRCRGYPVRFLRALDRAMAVLPKDRLQTADEWLEMISGGVGRDIAGSRPISAAVEMIADLPVSATFGRFRPAATALAAVAAIAGVAIAAFAYWPPQVGAPEPAVPSTTPAAVIAEADAPIAVVIAAVMTAPNTTRLSALPEMAVVPSRVAKPGVLALPTLPVAGPAQVQTPTLPAAPEIGMAASAPAPVEAAPNIAEPDALAPATTQLVSFQASTSLERPVLLADAIKPTRAPAPDFSSFAPGSVVAAPLPLIPVEGLPEVAADPLVARWSPPPALAPVVGGNPVAWSQWDIRMPFEEELVSANDAGAVRITSVNPRANLAVSGTWIAKGVTISAINGLPLQPGKTLADHFLLARAADTDGYMRATVRYRDPGTGESARGTLAVPLVRETLLSDGSVLVTAKENGSWVTRVETSGPNSTLREGDILLAEVFTAVAFKSHEDIAGALDALDRNGVERAEFNILRGAGVRSSPGRFRRGRADA